MKRGGVGEHRKSTDKIIWESEIETVNVHTADRGENWAVHSTGHWEGAWQVTVTT